MIRRFTGAVLALGVLALAGCSDTSGTGDKGYISGDGTISTVALEDRGDAIELAGESLDEEPIDLADLRGEVVVVNVWGAWCADCRIEQDDLVEVANETTDMATFLGINIRDPDRSQAQAYVRNFQMPYESIYSPDSKALLGFAGTLTPVSIPSTVILDREGRVAASILGRVTSPTSLKNLIEDVANEDD